MFCEKCGAKFNEPGEKFCSNCGAPKGLKKATPTKKAKIEEPSSSPKAKKRRLGLKIAVISVVVISLAIGGAFLFARDTVDNILGVYSESKAAHNQAQAQVDAGDYIGAIALLRTVKPGYWRYEAAMSLLTTAKQKLFAEADKLVDEEEFPEARSLLETVLETLPEDEETLAKISTVKDQHKEYFLGKARKLIGDNMYADALFILQAAMDIFADDADILDVLTDLQRSRILAEAAGLEAKGDIAGAIAFIRSELENVGNIYEVTEKLVGLVADFKKQLFAEAEKIVKADGYKAALALLTEGLKVLEADEDIINKIKEFEAYLPAPFLDFALISKGTFADGVFQPTDSLTDIAGKKYSNPLAVELFDRRTYEETYKKIEVIGDYSVLKGTFFVQDKTRKTQTGFMKLLVFGDDKLLETIHLDRETGKSKFTVNIKGCKTISIGVHCEPFQSDPFLAGLADLFLSK